MTPEHEHGKQKYHYFVDGERYEWEEADITGGQIKSRLPQEKRDLELVEVEERDGHRHLRTIQDETEISLRDRPKHFETKPYIYFVDGEKYDSERAQTTGRIIKSKLPEAKRGYALYLEGHGNHPDELINDDTTVSFEREKEPKRFYTVPPASFGGA
jgi:hypothetical protein